MVQSIHLHVSLMANTFSLFSLFRKRKNLPFFFFGVNYTPTHFQIYKVFCVKMIFKKKNEQMFVWMQREEGP